MKKLICFDFDGTLTESSSWYLFNTHFGMTAKEGHSLFEQYLNNGFDYKTWTLEVTKILKARNLCHKDAVEAFAKTITLREDAVSTVQACKDAGYTVVIISGGLKQIVEQVAGALGVDRIITTAELVFDSQGKFESIVDNGDEMYAKLNSFQKLCEEYGADPEYAVAVAVGDGGNDLEIFKKTKKGILLGNYEKLKEYAWKQIQNLSEIKELI